MKRDRPKWAFLVALLTITAGCTAPEDGPPEEPGPGTMPSEVQEGETESADDPPRSEGHDPRLRGNDCTYAWFGRILADELVDLPPPPPGWERTYPHPYIYPAVSGWTCEKMSIGSLERGPLTLFVETHDNASPPQNCRGEGSWHVYKNAHLIWTDSAALQEEFSRVFGVDVALAEKTYIDHDSSGGGSFGWTLADGGTGSFEVTQTEYNRATLDKWITRTANFPEAGGVVLLDFIETDQVTDGNGPAQGRITKPHIKAEHESTMAAGLGVLGTTGFEVQAQWFEELDCSS